MPQTEKRRRDNGGRYRPVSPAEQAPQHPAEGDLLEHHRAQRDEQESGQQSMLPAQVVAGVAEGVAGRRKRCADRKHHCHGSDRAGRPDQSAPPRSAAQANLLPAEPGPPGDRQEHGGTGRPEHQRRMRHPDIDHVDDREKGDYDGNCPAKAPRRLAGCFRHASPLPAARENADESRAHSVTRWRNLAYPWSTPICRLPAEAITYWPASRRRGPSGCDQGTAQGPG